MTGVEIATWCLHGMTVVLFIFTVVLLTMFTIEMVAHARMKRRWESTGPLVGYREHRIFPLRAVPKVGDLLSFAHLALSYGYAVEATNGEPLPPFKKQWVRSNESMWVADTFIFLGVAESWDDGRGHRWYGIVLRARDTKVLVFPDYCFEQCHPN